MTKLRILVAMFHGKNPIREQGIIGFLKRRGFVLESIDYSDNVTTIDFLPTKENVTLIEMAEIGTALELRYPWITISLPAYIEVKI